MFSSRCAAILNRKLARFLHLYKISLKNLSSAIAYQPNLQLFFRFEKSFYYHKDKKFEKVTGKP